MFNTSNSWRRKELIDTYTYAVSTPGPTDPEQYWEKVSSAWCHTEMPHINAGVWWEIFLASPGHNATTREFVKDIPTVYRGIDGEFADVDIAYSWTTDKDQAVWFSERWPSRKPLVLEYKPTPEEVLWVDYEHEKEVLIKHFKGREAYDKSMWCDFI